MKKIMIIFAAMLSHLVGFYGVGQAMAQRTLPGMKSVEVKANMVDGFYTGSARNGGYSFGVYYSVFKGNNAKEATAIHGLSVENISRPINHTERAVESPLLISQPKWATISTCSATTHSSFISMEAYPLSEDMRRSTGVRHCCRMVQRSTILTPSSMAEQSMFRRISIFLIESH